MPRTRLVVLAAVAAPALMLGACHKSAGGGAAAAAGPIAPAPAGGWVSQVARTDDGGYRMGNPNAPVKVIEYGSRTCPHCQLFDQESFPKLKQADIASGRVSYEYRDFAIHPMDLSAILLGRCVAPAAYYPLLDQMYAMLPQVNDKVEHLPPAFTQSLAGKTPTQQAKLWSDQLGYTSFAAQRGLPAAKADACLADEGAIDALSQQMQTAVQRFNVSYTPFFIVNGDHVDGAHDYATLKQAIDSAAKG